MGEYVVSAGTAEKRMYWLQQLQKCRREFSAGGAAAIRNSVNPHQVNFFQPKAGQIPETSKALPEKLKNPFDGLL